MEEHGVSKVVSVKFSPREETQRKESEKAREQQEERIDGAAAVAADLRPHEEDLHNDLLENKEQTVAPIADAAPVLVEAVPALGQPAPDDIKAEVQAAIASAVEAGESAEQTTTDTGETPTDKSVSPQ
jgi:hypothetical protein